MSLGLHYLFNKINHPVQQSPYQSPPYAVYNIWNLYMVTPPTYYGYGCYTLL